MISYDDFAKLDLRVGEIKEVKDHPNADTLYVLQVDIGTEIRQLVAGIRLHYDKKELLGKKIIVLVNLEPAVLRGVESQGMLLAAQDKDIVALLSPEKDLENGAHVR